jgi:shikimate dehydrogenase
METKIISVTTKLIALLGTPLGQSFAARMQNAAYAKLGLDYYYFPVEVDNHGLAAVINGIRHMNFAGFAVTKPNKIAVLDLLDELDPLAAKIGSVNTVVMRDGRLTGYNTDGSGWVQSLLDARPGIDLARTTFLIYGAGGAARAIATTLADQGAARLYITDMVEAASRSLVEDINRFSDAAVYVPFDERPYLLAEQADVLINATGLGMGAHLDETPVAQQYLRPELFVSDLIYNPLKTRLLLEAEAVGAGILNGLEMSINQGAKQVALWAPGTPEPVQIMREIIGRIVAMPDERKAA